MSSKSKRAKQLDGARKYEHFTDDQTPKVETDLLILSNDM